MKRILLFTLVIGLLAVQANAGMMWDVDQPTALNFVSWTQLQGSTPVSGDAVAVYDKWNKIDGIGPAIYGGSDAAQNPLMSGEVGFVMTMSVNGTPNPAEVEIYHLQNILSTGGLGSLGLTGTDYDGIRLYFQNDNNSVWSAQLFYTLIGGGGGVSNYVEIGPYGGETQLIAAAGSPGSLDLSQVNRLGIRIYGNMGGGETVPDSGIYHPSGTDTFHVSIVPVPAAVILGILGMGVAGLKLRKFA